MVDASPPVAGRSPPPAVVVGPSVLGAAVVGVVVGAIVVVVDFGTVDELELDDGTVVDEWSPPPS